jgi:hypothetical protein
MTEQAQGMSQSQDTTSAIPASTPAPTQGTSTPESPARDERTFRQSEVTDIVRRERQEAVDRYQRLQREQPQYAAQKYGESVSQQPAQPGNSFDESHYRKIAAEEAQRLRDNWIRDAEERHQNEEAQNTVQQFWNKVAAGKEKYQDFDKVTGDIQYASFPNVVRLLAGYIDNSGDVLYELGKDRIKMANLESLALMSPKDAIVQAQRLAQSLKDNESAGKVRLPNEPLSQMKPSISGMDSGALSVGDYRKKYRV